MYRAGGAPSWLDELDLTVSESHVRMGTRTLGGADWLVREAQAEEELVLRHRLLTEQRPAVLACTEAAAEGAEETAALVAQWLAERGLPALDDPDPLARAGGSVQEDLCLMVRHEGAWHLEGACLCFPSMWWLHDKLGRPAAEVHGPVPYYDEELSAKVDTFFDRLAPERPVVRRNLSLWPCCLLFVPTTAIDPVLWDALAGDGAPRLWLRSERQTLRRLARSGAILFTIKVQMAPVSVLTHRPDRAAALAAWLRGPGGESRRQQLGPLLDGDLAWLDAVGSGHALEADQP